MRRNKMQSPKSNTTIVLMGLFVLCEAVSCANMRDTNKNPVWVPDNGDGTYKNPVIFADYSDPDVIRVGDDFYLVSSSFNCSPGLPVLHSKDLVNWTIIGHVFQKHPSEIFNSPQHGNGVWAPSIRYHNGEFYVYYGDPDLGIFMAKTKNPAPAEGGFDRSRASPWPGSRWCLSKKQRAGLIPARSGMTMEMPILCTPGPRAVRASTAF